MKFLFFKIILLAFISNLPGNIFAQYDKEDSLRGSLTEERNWWNVLYYDLNVKIDPTNKWISGSNKITFKVKLTKQNAMQIDLQEPLHIDSILFENKNLSFTKKTSSVYWVQFPNLLSIENQYIIELFYSGKPIIAKNAPWDGGIVWSKDELGNDFIASACQGIGSSAWWPGKDHGSDEPDLGAQISITTPENLFNVSNGKLIQNIVKDNFRTTTWQVSNPINQYGINFNIGNYISWDTLYPGEKGDLHVQFFALQHHFTLAKKHFQDVYRTLEAFEYWFGPYPFYEDGYKLVEVPYLGMEHQSSVTYGNKFKPGYLGTDLSETGWGLKWDFIIIHESGHEWFANNITCLDKADMWIHESFTTYSEGLFTEYFYGKEAGFEYIRGIRKNILNDKPIIGNYQVNDHGSNDMYYKGANMLHTMRQIVANDSIWHQFLRNINRDFYHQIVTTQEIESYINSYFGINFNSVFNQYLRSTKIPRLKIWRFGKYMHYYWKNCDSNFDMPVDVTIDGSNVRIYPTTRKQKIKGKKWIVNPNYYILVK